jgi:hypothetical protein
VLDDDVLDQQVRADIGALQWCALVRGRQLRWTFSSACAPSRTCISGGIRRPKNWWTRTRSCAGSADCPGTDVQRDHAHPPGQYSTTRNTPPRERADGCIGHTGQGDQCAHGDSLSHRPWTAGGTCVPSSASSSGRWSHTSHGGARANTMRRSRRSGPSSAWELRRTWRGTRPGWWQHAASLPIDRPCACAPGRDCEAGDRAPLDRRSAGKDRSEWSQEVDTIKKRLLEGKGGQVEAPGALCGCVRVGDRFDLPGRVLQMEQRRSCRTPDVLRRRSWSVRPCSLPARVW